MKQKIQNSPKTVISTIIGALTVYALGKGWIQQADAEIITQLAVAIGLLVNQDKIVAYFSKTKTKTKGE